MEDTTAPRLAKGPRAKRREAIRLRGPAKVRPSGTNCASNRILFVECRRLSGPREQVNLKQGYRLQDKLLSASRPFVWTPLEDPTWPEPCGVARSHLAWGRSLSSCTARPRPRTFPSRRCTPLA